MNTPLTTTELADFKINGYLLREGFFPPLEMAVVQAEMRAGNRQQPYLLPGHRALISHPRLMTIMGQLCGPDFLFHHLNTYLHQENADGVSWHNDYEQTSLPMPRHHANIIVLIYPDGLRGEVGDLVMMPGTHRQVAAWGAYGFLGTQVLSGEVVIDRLTPGSAVICHTGLVHCRRPKPGPGPRYFCDTSYVARGPHWPATSQHDWHHQYATCMQQEHAQGGAYAHLFDASQFFDYSLAEKDLQQLGQEGIYRRLVTNPRAWDQASHDDSEHRSVNRRYA